MFKVTVILWCCQIEVREDQIDFEISKLYYFLQFRDGNDMNLIVKGDFLLNNVRHRN